MQHRNPAACSQTSRHGINHLCLRHPTEAELDITEKKPQNTETKTKQNKPKQSKPKTNPKKTSACSSFRRVDICQPQLSPMDICGSFRLYLGHFPQILDRK